MKTNEHNVSVGRCRLVSAGLVPESVRSIARRQSCRSESTSFRRIANRLHKLVLLSCLFTCAGAGCAAVPLYREHNQFRGLLLQLYDDQIMDNLVRTKLNLPIVQLDYSNITGTVTLTATGMLGGSQEDASGAIKNFFEYSLTGKQKNQMTLTANPVLNDFDVYEAYLWFVHDVEGLEVDDGTKTCHRRHEYAGTTYCVPAEKAGDYFALALRTTVLRGKPVTAPDTITASVASVGSKAECINRETQDGKVVCTAEFVDIEFDNNIPNVPYTIAKAVMPTGKEFSTFHLRLYEAKNGVAPGDPTKRFSLERDPRVVPQPDLQGFVRSKLTLVPKTPYSKPKPRTERLLDDIRHEMQLFRLGQTSN